MAMIDYGAIVFKNGKFINKNQFFMRMEESVGWVDYPNIRTPDCDCFDEYNGEKYSNCHECPKAQFEMKSFEYEGETETYRKTNADCLGEPINHPDKINGNYFAYIGNKHLTLAIYKNMVNVCVDGKNVAEIWWNSEDNKHIHKSHYYTYGDITFHIKTIVNYSVHLLSVCIDGDFYNVIFGYGIDSNMKTWNKIKNRYLGKRTARKVDNLIRKFWYNK